MSKDDIEIDLEGFLQFCKKIELKDNDILVFRCKSAVPVEFINGVLEIMSKVIRKKITKKSAIIVVGNEIDSISQISEKEMNRMGWFRRDLKEKGEVNEQR